MKVRIELDGRAHEVEMEHEDGRWTARIAGETYPLHVDHRGPNTVVSVGSNVHLVDLRDAFTSRIDGRDSPFRILGLSGVAGADAMGGAGHGPIRPPMTGRLDALVVKKGDKVAAGDVLFVLEAMKMRNEVKAPVEGIVSAVHVAEGDSVDGTTVVLDLAPLGD